MTVNFTAITDLVNATFTVLQSFVNNQSTLIDFAVLIIILAIVAYIGIWLKGFLGRMINKGTGGSK